MTRLSEQEFLAQYDPTEFERPSVSVDVAVLTVEDGVLRSALYRRTQHPSIGTWALPGGFVRMDESLHDGAIRLLEDKVGLSDVYIEQLGAFGAVDRDPRCRIISVAWVALVDAPRFAALERDVDATAATLEVAWNGTEGGDASALDAAGAPLPLFVDHGRMLGAAVRQLRERVQTSAVGFQLLPELFTLRELLRVHQAILSKPLNKDSFRRKTLQSGAVEATGELESNVSYRPAELYRFIRPAAV